MTSSSAPDMAPCGLDKSNFLHFEELRHLWYPPPFSTFSFGFQNIRGCEGIMPLLRLLKGLSSCPETHAPTILKAEKEWCKYILQSSRRFLCVNMYTCLCYMCICRLNCMWSGFPTRNLVLLFLELCECNLLFSFCKNNAVFLDTKLCISVTLWEQT